MADVVKTIQDGLKSYKMDNITDYSLFLGGINATKNALEQYDPLKTGYNRIFFVSMPEFMKVQFPDQTKRIRHLMEYGFTSISGIENVTLETETVTGGYTSRSFEVGSTSKDGTNQITLGLYEFSGSPVREYMDAWISGISDPYTGLGHYHGALDRETDPLTYSQANHVAEAIYVATDPTGRSDAIEYACLLANMIPKTVKKDHFNYESGRHELVTVDVDFTCTKYESTQINEVARALMSRYQTMRNYIDFKSEYGTDEKASIDITSSHEGSKNIINWPPYETLNPTKQMYNVKTAAVRSGSTNA